MKIDLHIISQYNTCLNVGGVYPRQDRGLIELTGDDRVAWLNNLVTNVVTPLGPGEGNYAFATNRQGRTVFDANILVLEDSLLLDIDKRLIGTATAHLHRFRIMEAVEWTDLSERSSRVALLGPKAADVVLKLGFGNLVPMAWLQHVGGEIDGAPVRMVRHDFAGLIGAEFIIAGDRREFAVETIVSAATDLACTTAGREVVDILRIEAGIPASVEDIDEDVIPPETGQIERGISSHKGCYLGQEVIERMRSHDILPRRLVGIRLEGDSVVPPGAVIVPSGSDIEPHGAGPDSEMERIGRITSTCRSVALGAPLCLGYVKSNYAKPDTAVGITTDAGGRSATVVALPIRCSDGTR